MTAPCRKQVIVMPRATCEGCAFLTRERPRCVNPDSEHYRLPRETYHDSCWRYATVGKVIGR